MHDGYWVRILYGRLEEDMRTGVVIKPRTYLYENCPEQHGSKPLGCDIGRKISEEEKTQISDEVFMGWTVGILEEIGDYIRVVTHYGYEGWIAADDVSETVISRNSGTAETESGIVRNGSKTDGVFRENGWVVTARWADVMSIPTVRGLILTTLCRGCFVTLLEENVAKGYRLIRTASGEIGYLPAVSIRVRKDTDRFLTEGTPLTDSTMIDACLRTPEEEEAFRQAVTETARGYLGTQYRWGGKSSEGIDCSGLAFMSYMLNGVLIYRDASIEEGYPIREIPKEEARKGDLIFFPGHVAVCLGEGRFIHSTGYEKSFGCVINSLNPGDEDYREDLANTITAVGSIFPMER